MKNSNLSDTEWAVVDSLAAAFLRPISFEDILSAAPRTVLTSDLGYRAAVIDLAKLVPLNLPSYHEFLQARLIDKLAAYQVTTLRYVLRSLNTFAGSLVLTGYLRPVTRLPIEKREQILLGWRDSNLAIFRKLFFTIFNLAVVPLAYTSTAIFEASRLPRILPDRISNDEVRFRAKLFYRFQMESESSLSNTSFDAIIVGSGCGAGVVASRLSREGYKILVLEKGKYYHQEELNMPESESFAKMFESNGVFCSEDTAVGMLTASTFGGGSTVNWSASLPTQYFVRNEWSIKSGVEFYSTREYSDAVERVSNVMGVSDQYIKHSKANTVLLQGSARIGSPTCIVPQNTGHSTHNCGHCGYGCRFGEKQGGTITWLVDAAKHGTKFRDQAEVIMIKRSNEGAAGVLVNINGQIHSIFSKLVVCAGGSMQTPVLLKKSGFKNKHIGNHLKIHPVNITTGLWRDEDTNAYQDSILTVVNLELENQDGKGHGVKLECCFQSPFILLKSTPWRNSLDFKRQILNLNNRVSILSMARDIGEGQVFPDPVTGESRFTYNLHPQDRLHIIEGMIRSAEICLATNADAISIADSRVPILMVTEQDRQLGSLSPHFQEWVTSVRQYGCSDYTSFIGSAHQMGTCRMGGSAKTSAVDPNGELWECKNVFVADASVLPSASGVNPMITIMATADIVSSRILTRLNEYYKSDISDENRLSSCI
ncbi:uncharacterized protein V1516DRAFT_621272 [Lipomyces oligophaga]|uniref:uncharacterized protein n=1 Tax=Lipomyces oligophaga TaxID=45792 RepID=UPI0034CFF14B